MKLNYDKILKETIKDLKDKKNLLLHSCCGPCSSYVLDYLKPYFNITILYYNPNIYPLDEYQKRLSEQQKLVSKMQDESIKVVEIGYNPLEYYQIVKNHENDKEGQERCHLCYKLRLEQAAKYAKENNYDYFTTTLSVSPYKNSTVLNEIGEELSKKYLINYLYADFKKQDGYKKSIELSKKYKLYRQDYCGCIFSKNNKEEKVLKK